MSTEVSLFAAVNLTCIAMAMPPPVYQWFILEQNQTTGNLANVLLPEETDEVLVFKNVRPEDRGTYTCSVSNDLGTNISEPAILSIAGEGVRGMSTSHTACPLLVRGVSTSHTVHCWLEEGLGSLPASHQLLDLLIISLQDRLGIADLPVYY